MPRSRMLASLTVPILALALVAPGSPALAQGTLDQQQTDSTIVDWAGDPSGYLAQAVQAGQTGRLVRVEIMPSGDRGNDADGMTLAIQGLTDGGAPDGHTVASATIDSTVVDDWVAVTFADPVNVTAGEVFAIVVGPSNGRYVTLHTASAAYANGSLWFGSGGGWETSYANHDMTFRTYVDTTYGFAWKSPTRGKGHGVNKPPTGTVPVTFTLDTKVKPGALIASGWPKVRRVDCSTKAPIRGTEWMSRPFGAKGLTRDGNAYTYSWHVRPEWSRGPLACRELRIKLTDGTTHSALFRFQPATKR